KRGGGMMAMCSSWNSVKPIDNDIGLEIADDPYHIGKQFFLIPVVQGFVWIFTETKINCTGKKLPSSIGFSCPKEFLRPDHPQFQTQFLSYQVLPSITSS